MRQPVSGVFALALGCSCYSGGDLLDGLGARNLDDAGPQITWDINAEPLPEIPFPNDVGTRTDRTSPTGRRVNVSREAPTAHERRLRELITGLDGFGTYSPIYVQFEARIDIVTLHQIQSDDDPANDGIYLVNVDPSSSRFGEQVPVDLGAGPHDQGKTRFPLGLENPDQYFGNDPRTGASNLLFETIAEDVDGDGECSPDEDTDDDGVCDRPNLWGEVLRDDYARLDPYLEVLEPLWGDGHEAAVQKIRQYFDLISCYELETETLIFRPVFPLAEATTYAVVLTREIVGDENNPSPIRSPFAWINHLQQTAALRPLVADDLLGEIGIELGDIAFAWTFTTQSITRDVSELRAGLYGIGPFERLASQFPPRLTGVFQIEDDPRDDPDFIPAPGAEPFNVFKLDSERLIEALQDDLVSSQLGFDRESLDPLFAAYVSYIDYFVFFSFESPAFLANTDGVFDVDPFSGDADYGRETVYVTCAVPKERGGHVQPFPVTFYSHGYTSSRFESLGFAGSLGRFGLATCSIDAYGHGLPSIELFEQIAEAVLMKYNLERLAELLFMGRDRDLNGDGLTDSGGDFWSANTFHTRDVVRQSMVDYHQVIRIMRRFGAERMPVDVDEDGNDEIAGDFDGNGVADFGGEQGYSIFGQSLGGIMSGLVGPADPAVTASVPTAGGGGLVQLALRTHQGGVVQAVYLPLMGPLIIGRPSDAVAGRFEIAFDLLDVNEERKLRFATVPDPALEEWDSLAPGDRVRVTNLDNGEIDEVLLKGSTDTAGLFRLQIAADLFDRIELEFFRAGASAPYRTIGTFESLDFETFQGRTYRPGDELRLLQEGFGHRRQTPSLRRLFTIAQMVIDPADPVNYARAYANPLPLLPEGPTPTNVLVLNTVGDMNVPVDTGISFSRAAGHFATAEIDPRYGKSVDQALLDAWVPEGLEQLRRFAVDPCHYDTSRVLFDVDDAAEGLDPTQGPHFGTYNLNPVCDGSAAAPAFCAATCQDRGPLRATVKYPWGTSGMRIPFVSRTGKHGFELPLAACHTIAGPGAATTCDQASNCAWNAAAQTCDYFLFDYNYYLINQIGWYFSTGGHELVDDPCLGSYADPCPFF